MAGKQFRYKWIRNEMAGLNPEVDAPRMIQLYLSSTLPPSAMLNNLIYTLGLVRLCASQEQAIPVHRNGKGKVYRKGDQRADETNYHLLMWLDRDLSDPAVKASLTHVHQLHDVVARTWPMRQGAFLHALASFTLLLDRFQTQVLGMAPLDEPIRLALVHQFTQIGLALGIDNIPQTWQGMEAYLDAYEQSIHVGYSKEGAAVADALITQFVTRWLPHWLQALGRKVIAALLEEPIVDALELPPPGKTTKRAVRSITRSLLLVRRHWLPDPRTLIHLSDATARYSGAALPKCPVPH